MLDIYTAIVPDRIAIKGGSTKPCIITVENDIKKGSVLDVMLLNH